MQKLLALGALATALLIVPANSANATPPTDVTFAVATALNGDPSPFESFGPARDEGLVCPSGTVIDESGKVTGNSPNGFNFQGVKHFICGDGSGEFFVNLQARIDFRRGVKLNWNVLRGTGAYEDLHGAGGGFGLPGVPCGDPNACVLDIYEGRVHID
jgi:hypothetical protein